MIKVKELEEKEKFMYLRYKAVCILSGKNDEKAITALNELRDDYKALCVREYPENIFLLDDPDEEFQKIALDAKWSKSLIHRDYNNDRFLKSRWFRMMKLKKGSLG